MTDFPGQVITPGEPTQPAELTYRREDEILAIRPRNSAMLQRNIRAHGQDNWRKYYQALSLEKLAKNDDAKKLLQAIGRTAATRSLPPWRASSLRSSTTGWARPTKPPSFISDLIAKPTILVPKPVVMLALADHYGPKNPTEAAKLLRADQDRISRYGHCGTGRPGTRSPARQILTARIGGRTRLAPLCDGCAAFARAALS